MKNFFLGILLLAAINCFSQGEKYIPVNLSTVLKLAGANNLTIRQYELQYQLGLAEVDKAKEWYLPTIFVGPSLHYLKGGTISTTGQLLNDVTQRELWLGGWITGQWDFKTGIYNVLASKQHSEALKYLSQAQRNQVIQQAVSNYYDLLTAQLNYSILTNLLKQSDTLTAQIKVQLDAGIGYQSEYLLAKSNYDHILVQLGDIKVEMAHKSDALLNMLNIDSNVTLVSSDTALVALNIMGNMLDTSGMPYSQYVQNRPEYKSIEAELKGIEEKKKSVTVGMLMPSIIISSPDAMLGAFGSPFYNSYRLDGAIGWNIPLGHFIYNGDVKIYNDNILIEQNSMQQFSNTVHQQINDSRSEIVLYMGQMNIAKQALKESAEALKQSIEREKLGTVRPTEVFQTERFYVQAQQDYLRTISNYNKAQYQLFVATGNNL